MDGCSKRSNKTVIQCLRYLVERNQTGWVKALPLVMNTVNSSTGFSPFQLHMGRSPRLIPPLIPNAADNASHSEQDSINAWALIEHINTNVQEAQDNMLATKVCQVEFTNQHRSNKDTFTIGDQVMLSMEH